MLRLEVELVRLGLRNVHVTRSRHTPTWGANSLLPMFLDCVRTAVETLGWTEWQFVQNLSETDWPMATLDEYHALLAMYAFLKSNPYFTHKHAGIRTRASYVRTVSRQKCSCVSRVLTGHLSNAMDVCG
jgi:hypothetical protein